MKISKLFSGLVLLVFGLAADAHAHLEKASPADGSVITASPSYILLSFSKPARLTALWIQKGNEESQKLRPLPTERAQQISVAAPQLQPGSYQVSWRVVTDDGHVASGKIHFTLSPEHTADQSPHR